MEDLTPFDPAKGDPMAPAPLPADAAPVVDTAPPAQPSIEDLAADVDAVVDDIAHPLRTIEHVAQEVEAAVVNVVHTIEHRCFGRPSADHPVSVTTHTGN